MTAGAPTLAVEVVDIAPLRDAHARIPGIYLGVYRRGTSDRFEGGTLYGSSDNSTWTALGSISALCARGQLVADAPSSAVMAGHYDEVSAPQVLLTSGALSSVGEDGVERGQNWCMLGGEVMGVATVAFDGVRTYTLSHLLRGLRDTDPADGIGLGEPFLLLDPTALIFLPVNVGDLGEPFHVKPVAAGMEVADADTFTVTLGGNTIRPFRPADVAGSRDGSNNLTVTWTEQSRARTSLVGAGGFPSYEEEVRFEVDILDAPGGTVLRTIKPAVGALSASYTAAEQTADGLTPGASVDLVVYQVSTAYTRGNPAAATV